MGVARGRSDLGMSQQPSDDAEALDEHQSTRGERMPHIACHHPQARIPGNVMHYGLIDAVTELVELP